MERPSHFASPFFFLQARKLAKAAAKSQGDGERNYEGYSLAYMMNQEMLHGASELKSTGAKLTASSFTGLGRGCGLPMFPVSPFVVSFPTCFLQLEPLT
jgi:hypothetical protein